MRGAFVGRSVPRVENRRLLTGHGRFVDDIKLLDMLHACFLRSPFAHARVTGIDTNAAVAIPGVVAVLTGADIAKELSRISSFLEVPGLKSITFDAMIQVGDKVRFVGDIVAMVIAESRAEAEDGCDAIEVDYEAQPVVANMDQALRADAPLVFDELGTNLVFEDSSIEGDVEGAFARAAHVVKRTFRQHRQSPCPIETRGGVASFVRSSGELTYQASTQSPHMLRYALARFLRHPLQLTHVKVGDVGGSFGEKFTVTREDLCVCAASRALGRPVKWVEDRGENLLAGGHAREETVEMELAVDAEGAMLGLRAALTVDAGAYPAVRIYIPAELCGQVHHNMTAAYKIPAFEFSSRVVATNKATYVAYRGPWAVETAVRERLLDEAARELGMDPVEFRRINLVAAGDQPYSAVTGAVLRDIAADSTLEMVVSALDYEEARARQQRALDEGRYLGIGVATHIEHNGREGLTERTTVKVELDGTVTVQSAQCQTGQGHETTFAQLVADELSIPFDRISLVYGDTDRVPFKVIGTGGSLASTMATGSVLAATREVKNQICQVAASMFECDTDDVEVRDGEVMVRGVPSTSIPLVDVATTAYMRPLQIPAGMDPALEATTTYRWAKQQWTVATHGCIVELDPRTGLVSFEKYVAAVDCGTAINPAIVEGQIRGGIAQGIAGALYEHSYYDDEAQFQASTFMDYLVPTAAEIPPIEVHLRAGPAGEVRPLGVGETGAIVSPPTVLNAIADALALLGVRVDCQHLPPSVIVELLAGSGGTYGDRETLA